MRVIGVLDLMEGLAVHARATEGGRKAYQPVRVVADLILDATEEPEQIAARVAERVRALMPGSASGGTDDPDHADRLRPVEALTEDVPAPPPVSEVDPEKYLEPPVQTSNGHGGIGRTAPAMSHVDGSG